MGEALKRRQEMSHAEWLERRRQYIGGSDAAAALGLSKWKSRLDLYREKRGELIVEETPVMTRGIVLEPLVAELYRRSTGHETEDGAWVVSSQYPWMATTPDLSDVDDNCIVQIKTTSSWAREAWGVPGNWTIPADYLLQCQHELAVTGAEENRLAVFFADQSTFRGLVWMIRAGMDLGRVCEYVEDLIQDADSPCEFHVIPLYTDPGLIADMVEGERLFWHDYVQAGVEPPDESIPQKSSDILVADERQCEILGRLRDAKKAENLDKERYSEIVEEVKIEIGEASGIRAEGICSITYTAPAEKIAIDYAGAVARALAISDTIGPEQYEPIRDRHTEVMRSVNFARVWDDLPLEKSIRAEIEKQFSTVIQGKRVFRPRFAKD